MRPRKERAPAEIRIDSRARWAAIGSPLRMRILMLLEDGQARRVREIAKALGRTPQALYRHLAILRNAGLVTETLHPDGAAYQCPAMILPVDFFAGQRFAEDYAHAVDRLFREAARACRTVPAAPGVSLRRLTQAWSLHLDAEGLRALNAATDGYFNEVRRLLREHSDPEGLPVYVVLGVALDSPGG